MVNGNFFVREWGGGSYLSHFWLYLQYILFLSGTLIFLVLIHRTIFIFQHYKSNQKKRQTSIGCVEHRTLDSLA